MITRRNIFLMATAVLAGSAFLAMAGAGGGRGATGGAGGADRSSAPLTLVHPTSPQKAPDAEGFLQRWLILEPISVGGEVTQNAVRAMVKKEYFPNQLTVIPHDGDKVTVGEGELIWHAVDSTEFNVDLYHFSFGLNKPSDNVLYWAVTIVNCPEEMKGVRLAVGSNDASVWWVNGEEVVGIYGERQMGVDDGVTKKLTLKKGANVIRVAVHNRAGATDFCARFLDTNDKPIKNLTLTLTNG
jgi:hypothetical protein